LITTCARLRPDETGLADPLYASKAALQAVARRIELLEAELDLADQRLATLVGRAAPRLLQLLAIGKDHAGQLLVTEALGVTLDHRVCEVELEGLDVPAHVAELVRACWELGGRRGLGELRLRKWAHMLGFGGHFSTKSRRYSTTLGALRRARVAYAIRRRRGGTLPLDAWGRPEDDQAVLVVASWHYLGSGYQSTGEAWLAASAAARAREARRIAKEELRTMTITAV
jgi:hypothetical protein